MHTVAIVGRPNVGKSALFNRLAGRKISIVHDQPGVTRDRLGATCSLGSRPFEIVDTGGIGAEPDPDFADPTRTAAEAAIASAAVILLTVDAKDGLTPLDQELASYLRSSGKPILLVVNKVDHSGQEVLAAEFSRLGFPGTFPVSAAHGRGLKPLLEAIEAALPPAAPDESSASALAPARIVLLGRPNVGKSSLTNAILGHPRTIVSDIAGTTRDTVEIPYTFDHRPFLLCDTAGMRHRSRHKSSVEVFSVMRAEKALRQADVCLLLLDATQGVTSQDKKIAQLIQEAAKAVLLVLNKFDLIEARATSKEERREFLTQHIAAVRQELFFLRFAPVVVLSARTGASVPRLFHAIEKTRQHATRRIGTGELNRYLRTVLESHPPPLIARRRLNLLYATQVHPEHHRPFSPPEIILFVNDPALVPETYAEFLERRLREKWEFPGLPLRLRWRGRASRSVSTTV